jgi:hypothetical protein
LICAWAEAREKKFARFHTCFLLLHLPSIPASSYLTPHLPFRIMASAATREETVLLVTAHPDDESMFFVPCILGLQAEGKQIHVLCLSSGDTKALDLTLIPLQNNRQNDKC